MKKAISIVLSIIMLLSLAPALSVNVSAAERKEIYGELNLKRALEADGDADIVIMNDIIASASISELGSTFITLGRGTKTIDLAGHKVEANATGSGRFTFIRVTAGAELIVRDSSTKQSGKLWADGDMVDVNKYRYTPNYTNKDVRYRDTIVVDGGSFTLKSGEIEAGRAKEVWVYNGMRVDMFDQQLNNTIAFGVLAKAIAVRYDGNAYQIVNGNAVTLNSGTVTIEGGKLTGKGYRNLDMQFELSYMDVRLTYTRAAALLANEGELTINGGTMYGMANADAISISKNVDIHLNAGCYKTQLLKNVIVPNQSIDAGNGFDMTQFVAEYDRLSADEDWGGSALIHGHGDYGHGAGNLGVAKEWLGEDYWVWLDGNPYYQEQWANSKMKNTAGGEAHTLTISGLASQVYTYSSADLADVTNISTVALLGTMAKNMTIDQNTITVNDDRIASVSTMWYRDNELITGAHEVRFGNYLAKATVYAKRGYKFTNATEFAILGSNPALVQLSSDGTYAVVWSQLFPFECNHELNEDWSWHYDEATHYQQCSVCGVKIAEEKHSYVSSDFGAVTTYTCNCGHSYDEENGKVKINGLVVDIPVAIIGGTIPQPKLLPEFTDMATITSWHIASSTTGYFINAGSQYNAGESYEIVVRTKANDGYYFSPYARVNCAATSIQTQQGDDLVIETTYKINPVPRAEAFITLPSMVGGSTMGEYLEGVTATVNYKDSGNIQATIKTHGKDDEVYIRKTLTGGWQLVRGASSLDAFWSTKIQPGTAYDISFDFSTDSNFVAADAITYYSAASYEGIKVEGGNVWFSVNAVVVADSNKVSDIALVSVMPPMAGNEPETDFDVLNTAALTAVSASFDASGAFEGGKEYTFTAKVKLNDGFEFADKLSATVNFQKASVSVIGNTATVTYKFPETDKEVVSSENNVISKVSVSIDEPKPGKDIVLATTIPEGVNYVRAYLNAGVYNDGIIWYDIDADKYIYTSDLYEGGHTYSLTICFRAEDGYQFAEASNIVGTINGKSATAELDGEILKLSTKVRCGHTYSDVKETDWFYGDMYYAYEKHMFHDYDADKIYPHGECKRADVVYALWMCCGAPIPANMSGFKDVSSSAYYAEAVYWAQENGIVTGWDGKFDPESSILREQMAAVMMRYAAYLGQDTSARADLSKFKDVILITWSYDYVSWANARGIINGIGNDLIGPQGKTTRSQVAALIHRLNDAV